MQICVQAITDLMKEASVTKWGDYWFKRHLRHIIQDAGCRTVAKTGRADASLLLAGRFQPSRSSVRSVWIYGNVSCIGDQELKTYFHYVYTLSDKYTQILQGRGIKCDTLLSATPEVYDPLPCHLRDEVIYMGSVKDYEPSHRYATLRYLAEAKVCRVNVVGEGWKSLVKGNLCLLQSYWARKIYRELFSQYKIGVYAHAHDLVSWDFVALRILDMLATGNCLVLSDYNEGVKAMFGDLIPMYKDARELVVLTKYFLKNEQERVERWEKARKLIRERHLLKYRAERIIHDFETLKAAQATR